MRVLLVAVAVLAILLPGATTAAEPRYTAERLKLRDAIELEQRAWTLLARTPPRIDTARLALDRAEATMLEVYDGLQGTRLADAARFVVDRDREIARGLRRDASLQWAFRSLELALKAKNSLLEELTPKTAGTQCADGKDNDRDGMKDARLDSGCTSARDGTERSPFTCSLGTTTGIETATVQGACSGPFFKLELLAPDGTRLDVMPVPPVAGTEACRFVTPQRLECLARDGVENPRHRFSVKLGIASGRPQSFRVRITDFAGRVRSFAAKRRAEGTADVRLAAKIDTAFMDRDGHGRVSGTLVVVNGGSDEARGLRLVVTSNRLDSARAAELDRLSCARTDAGTSCALPPLTPNVELAFSWAMPASGAGRFAATFEAAGRTTTVETDLRPQP